PGVVRAIIDSDSALVGVADEITDLLSIKDVPGLLELGRRVPDARADSMQALLALPALYGGAEVLPRARQVLPALPAVDAALADLQTLMSALPGYDFSIDLADMGSGYGYHSGVVFS